MTKPSVSPTLRICAVSSRAGLLCDSAQLQYTCGIIIITAASVQWDQSGRKGPRMSPAAPQGLCRRHSARLPVFIAGCRPGSEYRKRRGGRSLWRWGWCEKVKRVGVSEQHVLRGGHHGGTVVVVVVVLAPPAREGGPAPFAKIRLLDVTTRLIRRSHHVLNGDGPSGAPAPHLAPRPPPPSTTSPPVPAPPRTSRPCQGLASPARAPPWYPAPRPYGVMSQPKHQQHLGGGTGDGGVMGSDRTSKGPQEERRLSLASLFRRRGRESKAARHRSREIQLHAAAAGGLGAAWTAIASIESIPLGDGGSGGGAAEQLECPLCLLRHSRESFPDIMTCHHRSCADCLRQYLRIEISESRVNISCPECSERFNPHDIRIILGDRALMEKYEEFMLRRWLVADPDCRWCPAPDCGYAVIAFGCASCPKLTCGRDGCGTEFCYHCKQLWHPNQTCDAARQQRAQSLRLRTARSSSLSYSQESGAVGRYAVIAFGCASCPKLTCGRDGCGTEFCYHCKQLWHPNQTCDAARQQRAQSLRLRTARSSSLSYSQESGAVGRVYGDYVLHLQRVYGDCVLHLQRVYGDCVLHPRRVYGDCVLHLQRVYGDCVLHLQRVYGDYVLHLQRVYGDCVLHLQRVYGDYVLHLQRVYGDCVLHLQRVYGDCVLHPRTVYGDYVLHLQRVYGDYVLHLQRVYGDCVLHLQRVYGDCLLHPRTVYGDVPVKRFSRRLR
ncbi:hypothetical protein CRUP_007275 [Coryphaenoides rupestris]|nr:hypothetical protein CRUP_007275 [Coryphaenoides rupestris]